MLNETPEQERQSALDKAREDLKKEILDALADVRQSPSGGEMGIKAPPNAMMLYRFAAFLGILSNKADIQTRRIVGLTRVLVWLTVALLLFTAYLSYDAYLKGEAIKQNHKDQPEPDKANVQVHSLKDLL